MLYLLTIPVLGAVIVFHEFGHFVFAKLFGVIVTRFSAGFGPVVIAKKFGETEYALSAFPLGGYVKMASRYEELAEGQTAPAPGRAFEDKPLWQRVIVYLAGPVFNLILAFFLYAALYAFFGTPSMASSVGGVTSGSPAEKAGIRAGDKIVMIRAESVQDYVPLKQWEEFVLYIRSHDQEQLYLTLERDGNLLIVKVTPAPMEGKDASGQTVQYRGVGVQAPQPVFVKYPRQSVWLGAGMTWDATAAIGRAFKKLLTFQFSAKSFTGPVGIANETVKAYKTMGISGVFNLTAAISINLMFLNLFPLIAFLDGGQLALMLAEAAYGKPLNPKVKAAYFNISGILLLLLMVMALKNDLFR